MQVVILAAGKGTRAKNVPEGVSKCSVPLSDNGESSVARLIRQVHCHVMDAKFIVILGYGSESVIKSLGSVMGHIDINFIYNPAYSTMGCNRSLSCAAFALNPNEPVLILEGDSVYKGDIIESFCNLVVDELEGRHCFSLTRRSSYLTPNSVCVMKSRFSDRVISYLYDKNHKRDFTEFSDLEDVELQDSMQIWYVSASHTSDLVRSLFEYIRTTNSQKYSAEVLGQASGVFSINSMISRGVPVRTMMINTDHWYNLNTEKDFNKVKSLIEKGEL